ncbi:TolC family protein [Chryseobacterium arthrosphaerae]|uniref:TolC family protein n=1 Tax=Chryseobacterium arthrosphaerae TaxID=651561 RepID=UPI0023E22279|nr:TolC family protein [Chryseobacterium arthrosphaerae]WES98471.1 TolC family protein [Chryseobacterium arthrosphaerae]
MNIKTSSLLLGILFLFANRANAQDSISLKSAIAFALKHRYEFKIATKDAQVSAQEIAKIKARQLPTLTGTFDTRYNGKLATQVLPGEMFGNTNGIRRNLQFGTSYSTMAGLDLDIPIYNPDISADKRIARLQAEYDWLNISKSEIEIKNDVTKSYLNLLFNAEQMKLSKANAENTQSVYTMNKDQYDKGGMSQYDLEKSQINYESAQADYNKTVNSYNLAINDLAYRIGSELEIKFTPTDSLESIYLLLQNRLDEMKVNERVELKQQKVLISLSEAKIQKEQRAYWPTISAYGNLTAQNLNDKFALFNGKYWYPYNYVGIKASIPIFDGFRKQRTKQGYALERQSAILTQDKLIRDQEYEIKSTQTAVLNDLEELNSQKSRLVRTTKLYTIDKVRLQQGSIKPTDLSASYLTLLQVQNKYLNAVYNYLIDIFDYQKAIGAL